MRDRRPPLPARQWTLVPLAAKAFELIVQTVSREDKEEEDEGSFDSGGRDSENSEAGESDGGELDGRGSEGGGGHRAMSEMLSGDEVLNSKPPFMGAGQFLARKKEMVKTIMAGINVGRDQGGDEDQMQDAVSRGDLRDKCVEIIARLSERHQHIFNSCLQHISPNLKASAMEYAVSGRQAS